MGVVYRAAQVSLGRPVALKVISETLSDRDDFRERFVRESRLAASLDHPNVIPVYAAGEHDGVLYIAMRFVDGTDLRGLLAPRERSTRRARRRRCAGGFRARCRSRARARPPGREAGEHPGGRSGRRRAHVSHRLRADEANCVRQRPHRRRRVGRNARLRRSGAGPGEQVDGRADVYALGCVLYELLTGQVPFERDDDIAKLWAHISDPAPSPLDLAPDTPRALAGVVECCMEKDPDDRFETAGQMGRAALASVPGSRRHRHTRSHGSRPSRRGGRRWRRHPSRRDGRSGAAAETQAVHAPAREPDCRRPVARLRCGDRRARYHAAIQTPRGAGVAQGTGAPVGTIDARVTVGDSPAGVGLEGTSAWVANEGDGTVTRVDLKTRRARGAPIRVGKNPRAVATGGGSVWVANFGGRQRHPRRRGLWPHPPDDSRRARTHRHRRRTRIRLGVDTGEACRPDRCPLRQGRRIRT